MTKKITINKKPPSIKIEPVIPCLSSVKIVEEYKPSINSEKYPLPEPTKYQYKILAYRNDYIKLQEEVCKYINEGWELVGGVSSSMNVSQYESVTVFTQAIKK